MVNCTDINTQVQLEIGDTETFYVEPKHHKTEILLDKPLRNLPNGVCDDIVGNQIIRRVDSVILDGNKVTSIDITNDNIVDVLYFDRITTNKKFDSIADAAEYYGMDRSKNNISSCCKGK